MSENASYEANTKEELIAEIDSRGLDRSNASVKADLIKVLNKADRADAKAEAAGGDDGDEPDPGTPGPAKVGSDELVPTEAGDPERLTGDAVVEVERSMTPGIALGDIPLLDPRSTVGTAPKIPEGFESAAASARGARAEGLATTLGEHGMQDVEDALAARKEMADATGGEVLIEASGPVASNPDDPDDEG